MAPVHPLAANQARYCRRASRRSGQIPQAGLALRPRHADETSGPRRCRRANYAGVQVPPQVDRPSSMSRSLYGLSFGLSLKVDPPTTFGYKS